MLEKLKQLIKELQDKGAPLVFLRDPVSKIPSVSLTLLIVSFTIYTIAILTKFAGLLGGIDIGSSFQLLILTSSLYFGRKLPFTNTSKKDKNADP